MHKKSLFSSLFLQHALIDAISAFIVITILKYPNVSKDQIVGYIILYNFLAFATQWAFGLLIDKTQKSKKLLLIANILTITALVTMQTGVYSIILIGVANSIFHVCAGSTILKIYRNKAFYQGLYIAPGALGLLAGTLAAGFPIYTGIFILLAFIFFTSNMYLYKDILVDSMSTSKSINLNRISYFIVLLLLLVVGLRSLVGWSVNFPWKSQPDFFVFANMLLLGTFVGKALGGFLADKFGFLKVGVGSLLAAMLLITIGTTYPVAAVFGILFFQMTTALTLTAINSVFIHREGLSFGLTTLLLFICVIPKYTQATRLFSNGVVVMLLIALSAILLFIALTLYKVYTRKTVNTIINV